MKIYIYTQQNISHEKNETFQFTTKGINLDSIVLIEINQKRANVMFSLMSGI